MKSQSRNRRTGLELRLDETSGEWNDHNLKHKLRGAAKQTTPAMPNGLPAGYNP